MKKVPVGLMLAAAALLLATACSKKKTAAAPPPPPQAAPQAAARPAPAPAPVRRAPEQRPAEAAVRPRMPNAATRARIDELLARIEDAYFDYNKSTLRTDAMTALQADSTELRDILKDYPDYKLTIEGYCDERGSAEYNIALGNKRASAAKDYLVQVGIPSAQLNVVSYGKERPVCTDHDEACWQKNRRIHIVAVAEAR
ncbi:MAG TPA: peptidoglycan-associated lipoprotein Pal [Bryobacteraceae bacterium]|nr:peptidoglycan-associated lipoprotein Pal [Bryobacteraceae bacterium]